MRFESRTGMAAWRLAQAAEQETLSRIRGELDDIRRLLALQREVKYSPDQPRDWHGRWTSGSGEEPTASENPTEPGEFYGEAPDGTTVDETGTSGFSKDQENMTVQAFRSAYCLGSIREVLPGQFNSMLIGDVIALASKGDAAARRCLKLLGEPRFRK